MEFNNYNYIKNFSKRLFIFSFWEKEKFSSLLLFTNLDTTQ